MYRPSQTNCNSRLTNIYKSRTFLGVRKKGRMNVYKYIFRSVLHVLSNIHLIIILRVFQAVKVSEKRNGMETKVIFTRLQEGHVFRMYA